MNIDKGMGNIEQQRCRNCGGKNHPIELCPHKNKGTRCFRCNEFGHIGKNCETSRVEKDGAGIMDGTKKADDGERKETGLHLSNWRLQLWHGKVKVKAIVCTRTVDAFLRESSFMRFEYKPLRKQPATVENLFGTQVETLGSYELHFNNGDEGHYIQCHVIEDALLPEELLLGMNFIKDVDIVISKGKITVRRAGDDQGAVGGIDSTMPSWNEQIQQETSFEGKRLIKDGRVGSGTVEAVQSN